MKEQYLQLFFGIRDHGTLSQEVIYGPSISQEEIEISIEQHEYSKQRYCVVSVDLPYEVIKTYER
jgi:hypothetical protein